MSPTLSTFYVNRGRSWSLPKNSLCGRKTRKVVGKTFTVSDLDIRKGIRKDPPYINRFHFVTFSEAKQGSIDRHLQVHIGVKFSSLRCYAPNLQLFGASEVCREIGLIANPTKVGSRAPKTGRKWGRNQSDDSRQTSVES